MALKKNTDRQNRLYRFEDFSQALSVFENSKENEQTRLEALEYISSHKEISSILKILSRKFQTNDVSDHIYINCAFAAFAQKPRREEDFDKMFEMLQSDNAYLRNAAIKFVQEYGKEAKVFIEKLMNSDDRDIRIFAINILGDVNYDESIDMMRYFITKEEDLNALMTAVDYLGEIGSCEDIPLLVAVKDQYKHEPYVTFGIDLAIDKLKEEVC